jgi:hypothetical protein
MSNLKRRLPHLRTEQIPFSLSLQTGLKLDCFPDFRNPSGPKTQVVITFPPPSKQAQAFTLSDIRFKLLSGECIPASQLGNIPLTNPVVRVWVTHSWQKNHDNGEQRLFVRNERVKGRCACRAWERIVRRFLRIRGPNDEVTPLALFLPNLGTEPRLVTSTDIIRETFSRKNDTRKNQKSCSAHRGFFWIIQ